MKQKIGIFLLIGVNTAAIILNAYIAIFTFGLIVQSDFSLEDAADLVTECFTKFISISSIALAFNFLILQFLRQSKLAVAYSFFFAFLTFVIPAPIILSERNRFLENGRGNSLDIDLDAIKEMKVKDTQTGTITRLSKSKRETIWDLEHLMSSEKNHTGRYEIQIELKNGDLIFYTNSFPSND